MLRSHSFSLDQGLNQLHQALFNQIGCGTEEKPNLVLARLILADIHSIQERNHLPLTEISPAILPLETIEVTELQPSFMDRLIEAIDEEPGAGGGCDTESMTGVEKAAPEE